MKKIILKSIPWIIIFVLILFNIFEISETGLAEYKLETLQEIFNKYRDGADSVFKAHSDSILILNDKIDSLESVLLKVNTQP
ncbi:MAG: hypothetical protein RJQ09_15115 [Cyclobacteriaceae bacterium]